jgi:uncharacterized damage-inducible protein DinB
MAKKTKKKISKGKKAAPKAKTARRPSKKRTTSSAAMPSAKQQYLDVFAKEHATTLKVMRAFPADQGAFQPHPRSSSAKKLMWTVVVEQDLVVSAVNGTLKMPPSFAPEPATVGEAIAAFESRAKAVTKAVAKAPDSAIFSKVPFFVGPGKMGEVPVIDIMWLMLMDQIHHRGQLSVYNRMAGGLVPSIYGPSADEPWM